MVKKVLCATDGSHSSEKAIEYAVQLTSLMNIPLTFVTVYAIKPGRDELSIAWDSTVVGVVDEQVHATLAEAKAKAVKAGIRQADYIALGSHHIAPAIINYAEQHGFDQIVVGHTGRAGITRMAIGSVASQVVELAHCPVTIVR